MVPKLTAAEHARYDDLAIARRTIGDTLAARLEWLLRFLREDPGTWHSMVRTAHGDNLLAFGYQAAHLPPPAALTAEAVEQLHRELRRALRDLVEGRTVALPTDELKEGLVMVSEPRDKRAEFSVSFSTTNPRTGVFHALRELLLSRAASRLRRCPRCGAPFLAVRRQAYCTERCSQRERNERKKTRKGAGATAAPNVPENVPATVRKGPLLAPRQPTRRKKSPR